MYLKKISLFNFKNFNEANFEFEHKINCFVGKNGVGKTNILDAIYHLSFGKSYFNTLAVQNIKHGEDFFVIDGEFEKQKRAETIICSLKKGQKKLLKRNGKLYEKFSDHLGFIPLVIISPTDTDLIREGSETRRKFMDSVISQLDNDYLQILIKYQKIIGQRNALLKYFAVNRIFETETIEIYNEQLNDYGNQIYKKRKDFLTNFIPIFDALYSTISDENEKVQLVYDSQLHEKNMVLLLQENINKDRVLQYTSVGIHKDDLLFQINDFSIKKFGSQGQQKSFLIALKLAEFEFIKKQSGEKPILLLDDIFDKLDEIRVSKIVEMVNNDNFGQLFISDTHSERTENIVKFSHKNYKIFNI
jgi:DNA replication and repair protein RecF